MGIFSFLKSPKVTNAVAQGKTFALNELDQAIQAAKQTPLGTVVANTIASVENKGLTGPQKLGQVLATVTPLVIDYAERGGVKAVVSDAEVFASHLIESMLADTKKTGAYNIAQAILALIKKL